MNKILNSMIKFFKSETVLSIAGVLAVISAFVVPPSMEYFSYVDYRVLALLFCLMLVVAGLKDIGTFHFMAQTFLKGAKDTRALSLILVFICFFSAMLITNDVALITFVPFAVLMLTLADKKKLMIPVIVLQTIAANLGSMLTPVGNPQNLYLYSAFNLSMKDFILDMLPITVASAIMLIIAIFLMKNEKVDARLEDKAEITDKRLLILYMLLFAVCLLCVLRILHYTVMLVAVVGILFLFNRKLFAKADYFLLLTFVCFFIFIGNMENIPAVYEIMEKLISGRELILGVLLSQVISNVPAAILLSGFTDNSLPLLYGVNIGGLGTLIASLASVISYRAYAAVEDAQKGKYILTFTIYSLVFLAVLIIIGLILV